jgi:hypothetical protein
MSPCFSLSQRRLKTNLPHIAILALSCTLLTIALGCGTSNLSQTTQPAAQIEVAISPRTVTVSPNAKQRFAATVTGTSNTAVTWAASAGSISSDGTFTAPAANAETQITITAISVADSTQHAVSSLSIQPISPLAIVASSLNGAVVNAVYSTNLSATGGTPPYQWTLSAGALAPGIRLDAATGTLAGTTNQQGQYVFKATVTDASSSTATHTFTLAVSSASNSNSGLCGAPNYCSSTSTANPGTITPLFSGTTGVNKTAYDTTYNPAPLDCYTRATDSTTFGGKSVGNNTYSGGDNDIMWSKNSDFVGTTNGGYVYILNLNVSGNCAQVLNTGNITGSGGIGVPGPFAFSKVTDNVFYNVQSSTQIYKNTITVPYDKTYAHSLLFDFADGTTCPGLPYPFNATWEGILGLKNDDSRFGLVLSNSGGQGTGTWAVVYDKTLGCAVENTETGAYWAFCNTDCGPSTPPTGTLASSATCTNGNNCSCWGGYVHDSQMSGDGTQLVISESLPAWTHGACAGNSVGTIFSIWAPGTPYTQYCSSNVSGLGGLYCGGHDSVGTSKIMNSESGSVVSTRALSNVLTYTQHTTGPLWAAHGYWPQPDSADDYPYVQTSYGLLSSGQDTGCGDPSKCPIVGGNAIFADYPANVGADTLGQARTYFGHTYSCSTSSDSAYATCGGVADHGFGCQYSIMSVSQDGNWAMIASGMLLNLGLDSKGNSRCDTFIVHLR